MEFVRNLKLGQKMAIGFGSVIVMLVLTALTGYIGYNIISKDFAQYRGMSDENTLAGKIQTTLLESRLAFKSFVQTGNNINHEAFDERYEKMEAFILDLKASLSDAELKDHVEKIHENARQYRDGFDKVVDFKVKRDNIYDLLNETGPNMEKNITAIIEAAYKGKDTDAVYRLGMARRHLILARLHAARFLENNDFGEVAKVEQEFVEFDKWMASAKNQIFSVSNKDAIEYILNDKVTYANSFQEIASLVERRNITIEQMDQLGPQIAVNAEEIKQVLLDKQETYGPLVNKNIQILTAIIAVIAVIALVLSMIITITITKLVVQPVTTVTETFKEVSEGEADLAVRLRKGANDELGQMALYFNKFMEKLEVIMSYNKNQSWLKTGQAELDDAIRAEQDLNIISSKTISYVTKYINAQVGAFYIKDGENRYHLIAGYACNAQHGTMVRPGEGLIGQAILEKQPVLISDIPGNYPRISSGVGEALPKQLLIFPCIINDEVKCVMEFGSFSGFSEIQMEFLKEVSHGIAINLNSAETRVKMEQLLEKTLEQSEELQMQQEELRQTNEELEEQTKALKESEASLQAQQEELRVMNEELSERTKSLEIQKNDISEKNKSLKVAQVEIENKAKALETASKYKSEFLANMSHELRTPLNSILVLSQLLANKTDLDPMTQKQLEYAKTINTSGSDLLRLINDILDLSKVEAGKMVINSEISSIGAMMENLERNFAEIAVGKDLDFIIEVEKNVPEYIKTDMQRVQQIITNLLSNAFKFTDKGKVALRAALPKDERYLKDGFAYNNSISFAVEDTGLGIAPEKQAIIFEAFMQSDGTTSRKFGGTGLGLSISRELASLLNGKIYLESTEGKGSIFTLLLPLGISDKESNKLAENMRQPETVVLETVQQTEAKNKVNISNAKTLLIIEDDKVFAGLLKDLAEEKGYKCIIENNGEEGIKTAVQAKPAAILLDIGLPGIDGWNVIEQLEKNLSTAQIPVHIISGGENLKGKCSNDIVIGYLQKPVDIENLNNAFETIEDAICTPCKKLLVIGDMKDYQQDIEEIREIRDLEITYAKTGKEAYNLVLGEQFDCMIMDIQFEDITAYDLLHKLRNELKVDTPIIIYTDKTMNQGDELRLRKYTESIIIRGSRSPERLIAEANLFLHELEQITTDSKGKLMGSVQENEMNLANRKILIVDDDMRNVFALSSILEEHGMKTVVGRNGIEGLDKLKHDTDIDLVLMDIMMPEMDGFTAMHEIRKNKSFSALPIIALTAKAMKEDKQKCIEAGANDYLTKPIDINKLISLLRVWLHK